MLTSSWTICDRRFVKKFAFTKQVALASVWMEICTKNEEYEMASAIKKERIKIVDAYLKNKIYILYKYFHSLQGHYHSKTQIHVTQ